MSLAHLLYLCNLFGSDEHSDCTVCFSIELDGTPAAKRPRTRKSTAQNLVDAGRKRIEDLPAHLLVLCGGSEYFSALYRTWRQEQPHPCPPHHKPLTTAETASSRGPLELPVAISSVSELPHVRAAIRFIYTGKLPHGAVATDLLQIRLQATRLKITGCVENIDAAIAVRVTSAAGVMELYNCRHLLPRAEEAPQSIAEILMACRKQLNCNCSEYLSTLQSTALGELLVWLFPDAPSVLSNPDVRKQMEALPGQAMEALLRADTFATDDEATVLLMLAYWLAANTDPKMTNETRLRLCRLVRLSHLNTAYLHGLLPKIPWLPISRQEHMFLCQYVAETDSCRRMSLLAAAAGKHDCKCPWYAAPPRPQARADVGHPYEWTIKEEDLAAYVDMATIKIPGGLSGSFANGASRLVAQGFEWYPGALWFNSNGVPEVALSCAVPAPFAVLTTANDVVGVASVHAQVAVFRWKKVAQKQNNCNRLYTRGSAAVPTAAAAPPRREVASSKMYGSADVVSITSGQAGGSSWRLTVFGKGVEKAPGASARLMQELAPYFYDRKLSGSVTFLARC
ncbi:hypothetical protein VOLCADRAFT_86735 [Volvox carteri f. nagariensis]|uniref:BTB domain-containing protein n=1 Tax=Volvox carteri f. nagariensis TaxID=3068 RepID=D8TJG7_VOLCA|nr:uncharacterized protein VOLCADRAFT_86735 [Volvox carteri f. nagariensis]EFJ52370.1 hypothetical protein VOLCADRAFT_86735 [Volvox carteri f. nagariensis]|eukprot:XP_002946443.1 hypothetical protein VOLCADRAFT_86735 [Volvox carteri f. nagariensis]